MRSEEHIRRCCWVWLALMLGIGQMSLPAQTMTSSIDLGVFNGELKAVQRNAKLHGVLDLESLTLSNEKIQIETLLYDSLQDRTDVVLNIDVSNRIGQYIDTLSLVTTDGFVKGQYFISYQILSPVNDVFKSYRNVFWPFKSKNQVFNLKIGYAGDTLQQYFDLLNFSGQTLDLSNVNSSDSIEVSFEPLLVEHNSFTRMYLAYKSRAVSSLGFSKTTVLLMDAQDTLTYLPIQYSLVPKRSVEGPSLNLTRSELDYKVVKEGDLITEVVLISNEGNKALEIFKVESNCECLLASMSSMSIAPLQNAQLRIRFDTKGRSGLERKTITLFTNEPSQPVKTIVIKAHIK